MYVIGYCPVATCVKYCWLLPIHAVEAYWGW